MQPPIQMRLQTELKKVNNFAVMKHEDIFLKLRQICQELERAEEAREKSSVMDWMFFFCRICNFVVVVVPLFSLHPQRRYYPGSPLS